MKKTETRLKDMFIIEPKTFGDERGWFYESWSKRDFEAEGLFYDFVQDNHSFSAKKGTLRGLHFQKGDAAQAKLVRCTRGAIYDVAVDLRKSSSTYMQWAGVELSEENKRELLVPRGFAHGFVTLCDNVEFIYRCDNYYCPEAEGFVRYNDKQFGIEWRVENPIMLKRDLEAPLYNESEAGYV